MLNHLDHLAEEVWEKGGLTLDWDVLRNLYFRGDDPVSEIKRWAENEGLQASFDYRVESFTRSVVRTVYFLPKR